MTPGTGPLPSAGATDRRASVAASPPLQLFSSAPVGPGPGVVWARAGDHPAIRQFLLSVFQGPGHDEFQSSLDDPFYEPTDRLLVKQPIAPGVARIVSHVHLIKRTMHFGRQRLPVTRLSYLGTLPEFRGRGHATTLLESAERQMREDGRALSVLTTRIPEFFRRFGWSLCGASHYTRAGVREILARISAQTSNGLSVLRRQCKPLCIRQWRHIELDALDRIYRQTMSGMWGPLDRGEAYWRWLISRRSFDGLLVAIDGPDRLELGEGAPSIIGYAATKGDEIVELLVDPSHPQAAVQLLARSCGEAIERDQHSVALHAPRDERLHELMIAAGGVHGPGQAQGAPVHMMKLLDPARMLSALCPELHRRARTARLKRPCEFALSVEGERHLLHLTPRGVRLIDGKQPRHVLRCQGEMLTRLLTGQTRLDRAVQEGCVGISSRAALAIAQALFPPRPMWLPPWDELAR